MRTPPLVFFASVLAVRNRFGMAIVATEPESYIKKDDAKCLLMAR
jgi:hypothetical protein